jgi:hypothetical protein
MAASASVLSFQSGPDAENSRLAFTKAMAAPGASALSFHNGPDAENSRKFYEACLVLEQQFSGEEVDFTPWVVQSAYSPRGERRRILLWAAHYLIRG